MIDTFLMMGLKAKIGVNWKILFVDFLSQVHYEISDNYKLQAFFIILCGKLLNASKLLMRLSSRWNSKIFIEIN
jgi:hypothetical protein